MIQHITVAIVAILLCLIPDKNNRRKKYMLPLSFLIVTVFFAIRYNYGLDYMSYQNLFDMSESSTSWRDDKETFFYIVMNRFGHFYQFVIFHTVLFMTGLFLWVRKYCNEKYYALFFLMLMFMQSMSYNLMSSMRSTMAACILWGALYFFYIKKKNWFFYSLVIIIASGFHLSILSFIILPFVDYLFPKIKGIVLFYFLIGCFIFSLLGNEQLFDFVVSNISELNTYGSYYERVQDNNISIFGTMNNALFLFPAYFICRSKDLLLENHRKLFVLAFLFLTLYSLNLDIQNRFTSYIGLFFILIISIVAGGYKYIDQDGIKQEYVFLKEREVWIMLVPLIFKVLFDYYKFYLLMLSPFYKGLDGNPLFYQTIFDAPYLP